MDVRRKGFITPELATEYLAGAVLLGAAFATTVGVLTEVPVMLALCWSILYLPIHMKLGIDKKKHDSIEQIDTRENGGRRDG